MAAKVPFPGRASTRPSTDSWEIARCTVSGLARWRRHSSRTDGSRSPARAPRARRRSSSITVSGLLSSSMRVEDNASRSHRETLGLGLGLLGVLGFSLSLPATDVALRDLDPWFVGLGRAVVAAALALL